MDPSNFLLHPNPDNRHGTELATFNFNAIVSSSSSIAIVLASSESTCLDNAVLPNRGTISNCHVFWD